MTPLVSILIPNYNKSPYLKKTLDSVLAQTYAKWECIIVDDHSTDNSWEILEEYVSNDSRFRIFRRPKNRIQGGNAARNCSIEWAKGEFVAFLDSDDIWQPKRLELAISFLRSHNFKSIYSGAIVVRPNLIEKLPSRDIRDGESVFDFILSDGVFCPTPSLVMKSELAKKVMFDENLMRHQDYDFFIRAHMVSPWKYFENYDVRVNWTRADLKKINYYNCIPFYEKHWEKSANKAIRYKYIVRITSSSIRESSQYYIAAYFKKILNKEGYTFLFQEYILFYFPHLFFVLSKIKWVFRGVFYNK
ncbi:glycosyltransferase family 2 protein [Cyclobacterium jeungdonense]|uniref:Glycosyltransferase family 2 protein n=1 Tax=Cyclobacterium jeungdonense TaxID=708087 RepID=A0ABT8CGC2_9BACT|nr:glycosyltransferase family 2 protein [Cyclobacterium jeungdonense]MDN3690583.1 glycosyltransferase family 2 protein [Cyclobacterium jeungdonense]